MKSLDFVDISTGAGSATLTVDTGVYSLDIIKRAAFCFVEFCYVFMEPSDGSHIAVTLTPKLPGPSEELLEEFIGEYANELLNQLLRDQLQADTRNARELIVGRALFAASGEGDKADDALGFLDDDDDDDFLDDPLGIAVPWEDQVGGGNSDSGKEEQA